MRTLTLLTAICLAPTVEAQCPSCGPRPNFSTPTFPTLAPKETPRCPVRGASCDCGCREGEACTCLSWVKVDGTECEYALLRGGKQVGNYCTVRGVWRSYENGEWGPKEFAPPEDSPALPVAEAAPPEVPIAVGQNFGVDTDKIGKGYTKNGKPATRAEVMHALTAAGFDDASKIRLTVIGSEEQRKRVLADLDTLPAFAAHKDRLLVQAYGPTDWAVAKSGFVTTGTPTIYLQSADGKVLHRQDDYPSAEALAEAVRKADPEYRPKLDPDLNRPALAGGAAPILLVVGGLAGLALYLRSRKD